MTIKSRQDARVLDLLGLNAVDAHMDCFLASGSKVLEGYGECALVVAAILRLTYARLRYERMGAENLLVRILGSCETTVNTSVSVLTGLATHPECHERRRGIDLRHAKFVHGLKENEARTIHPNRNRDNHRKGHH